MTNLEKIDELLQLVGRELSFDLGIDCSEVDYEVQSGGKFFLFRVHRLTSLVSDAKARGRIYAKIFGRLGGSDAKWMVVFLNSDGDVVDVIDSIIGY